MAAELLGDAGGLRLFELVGYYQSSDERLARAPGRLTGVIGAIIVTPLMNALGIEDMRARGFAVGVTAHGIGTARAFQVDAMAGTFAGIGMGLNAMLTPVLVPILLPVLLG